MSITRSRVGFQPAIFLFSTERQAGSLPYFDVNNLWPTLVEFLFRLSFGLSLAMLITPAKWVAHGFFRVHLWVLMGLGTFTALAIYSRWSTYDYAALTFWLTMAAAVVSYLGAVIWMYDARMLGKIALALVTLLFCSADVCAKMRPEWDLPLSTNLDFATSSLLLGSLLTAMLLGHWYLNHPGMKLEPLKMLTALCGFALILRAGFAAAGLTQLALLGELPGSTIGWSFLAFRWLAGLIGPGAMAWLTWETLKVPNTQSATGILYAAVTLTFLGELTSQLLSRGLPVPV